MTEKIVIVGAGGFGREVFDLLDRNLFTPVGFIDPNPPRGVELPLPVLGDDSFIKVLKARDIAQCLCVAIGNPQRRRAIFQLAAESGLRLPAIVHSSAVVFPSSTVERGAIVFPHAVITASCRISQGVLVNCGATLGHDVNIGDFTNIGPGAHLAGCIDIGQEVFVGIGACVREKTRIEDRAIIGAGSVVVKDVVAGTTVYGVPARERNEQR